MKRVEPWYVLSSYKLKWLLFGDSKKRCVNYVFILFVFIYMYNAVKLLKELKQI